MRVTQSMYYDNLYGTNNSKLNKELFDVNKQIASGLKIQYASDDVRTFTETMRLDNELTTIGQIKKSTESGYKVADQTDVTLNEFTDLMNRMRTLLIQASNTGSSSTSSQDAISKELRGIEKNLKNLANTSINGQYLFSGSATDRKPISSDGTYNGDDISLNSFVGSRNELKYNITGADLFLGEELGVNREITTNVTNYNLTKEYPKFTDLTVSGTQNVPIQESDTIRELMGDNQDARTDALDYHFYVSGSKSNGEAISKDITMGANGNVSELLKSIGTLYGNDANQDVVNVSLNQVGEIVIEDKLKGSSKLEFNMTGAVDFNRTDGDGTNNRDNSDAADITSSIYAQSGKIDNLKYGENDFKKILNGTSLAANSNLYVKSFVASSYTPTNSYVTGLKTDVFSMSSEVLTGDTFTFQAQDANGTLIPNPAITATAASDGDYTTLKNAVETDGNFTVSINNDVLTFDITAQGAAKGITSSSLTVDNVALTITKSSTMSEVPSDMNNIVYDRTQFIKDGSSLIASIPQIVKDTNAFASPSTKLSEVADLSQAPGTVDTLDGTSFRLSGKTISGTVYDVQIDLKSTANGGSSFSLDTNGDGIYDDGTYSIFDMSSPRAAVDADEMTYQQLLDTMNMVVTNQIPAATNTETDYDNAIRDANANGKTYLSSDGKIGFEDINTSDTKAVISLHDVNSGDFSSVNSVMTFNANNALTIRDPKTDFFKSIDTMIKSVEEYKGYPDSSTGEQRGTGVEDAVQMMDDLFEHVSNIHSTSGAQSNTLSKSLERVNILEISAMTLRSSTIDTDLAESSLKLTQLSLNYQAMLSTVGKVSQLSLVNYL